MSKMMWPATKTRRFPVGRTAKEMCFRLTVKHDTECDDQLVNGLAENVLGHGKRDESLGATVRLSQEEVSGWHLCS